MRTQGIERLSPSRETLSASRAAGAVTGDASLLDRWLRAPESARRLDAAERAELAALRGESDPGLFYEGLLAFGAGRERAGRLDLAAEIYAEVAAAAGPESAARARRCLDAATGRGAAGPRAEFLLRRFAREASDPAMLAGMGTAGAVFRLTRLAVLGRLAAAPGAGLFSRGFGARALASLAGFALEAPAFTLATKAAGGILGRDQDWSGGVLARELASSYLVLGGLKVAGWGSGAAYRRFAGPVGAVRERPLRTLFQQTGMLGGILLGHAAEERLGLRPHVDGATTLVDSLAMLLQFHVAGRLGRSAFGEGFATWERSLDLQSEILASRPRFESTPTLASVLGPRPAFAAMMSATPAEELLGGAGSEAPLPRESAIRPAPPRPAVERAESPSAEGGLRRLLAEAAPLTETQKRELILRIQSGDRSAADALIRSDIRFVANRARHYARVFGLQGQDYLDLVQEGCRSLVKTAERFDLSRSNKFLTYASWWVRADLTRYILDHMQDIRVPAHRSEMLRTLRREIAELRREGADYGIAELAERLDLTERQVTDLQAQGGNGRALRLEAPMGPEGEVNLLDLIPAFGPAPDQALVGGRLLGQIRRFIESRNSERERVVLEARLLDPAEPSQVEIAERLGMTRGEVKNLEKALLARLRHYLSAAGLRQNGEGVLVDAALPGTAGLEPLGKDRRKARESDATEAGSAAEGPRLEVPPEALRPRIAVIGFGMAGVGATNALRNYRLFSEDPRDFRPEITVFEGMSRVGGKVAPDNLGAQFIDRSRFYPIDRLIRDLGLEVGPLRADYDSASFVDRSGVSMSGAQFSQALRLVRQAAREALRTRPWEELDRQGAVDFIRGLGGRNGPLDAAEVEAMVSRLGFEEGTLDVSLLSFAINLAKSETPMERYEIVGGLHRLPEAEGRAVEAAGGRVLLGHPVRGVEQMADGLKVFFNRDGALREERFDYGILALAPEHLRRVEVGGTQMPLDALARLEPAHIVKSNLRSNLPAPEAERAGSRYAMWLSPDERRPGSPMTTFFHGWNGEPRLTPGEMIREAYGVRDPEAVVEFASQAWDGRLQDGIAHFYTTMPQPGRGLEALRFAMDQYFAGRYDGERLKAANHVLGLGCYIRDAALSGEWAAVSLLRG
ncbi:MAG: sigma-70 family RNA polymerase sigma factor, partial [Deltaproteobacteria bacterium]|nr:sigma-70 family RNA polymerase sigma factor [Deltaproteobacteria bacterium]